MARRPKLALFDVNETVFSLDRLARALSDAGLADQALPLWFARVLRDGFALCAVGDAAPFRTLAARHLQALLAASGLPSDDQDSEAILGAFAELDAHPDAAPALTRLRDEGVRVVTLTNGHAEMTEHLLERNRLRDHVERCLSVDEVGVWKPRAEPYRYAAAQCGVAVEDTAMVAVHSWDVDGAKRAGLTTGYATRLEGAFIDVFTPPDVTGEDLVAVVDGLLALDG